MMNRVVVVGKNSYIGEYLVKYLEMIGSEVVSLSSSDCNFLNAEEVGNRFLSFGNNPATIVFLAVIKKNDSNDYQAYLDNISLVNSLIRAGVSKNIRSIIYMSSVDVYGRNPMLPIDEETRIKPDTWYGLAKYTCERMLNFSETVACPIAILRIPGIFGKSHSDNSVIGKMVGSARANRHIVVNGDGATLRDYVSLDDLCELISLFIPKQYHGVINIVTGKSNTIFEIANCVRNIFNIDLIIKDKSVKDVRSFDLEFDNSKLTTLFPKFHFTELSAAIRVYL